MEAMTPGRSVWMAASEKDINLKIARKVKAYLEASDVQVVLTREDDQGSIRKRTAKKKMADMNRRCQIINETSPALTVSIHQNSYHRGGISGGQVFYYKGIGKRKKLAETLQKRFDFVLGDKNTRVAKANDNYFLLLHVIVRRRFPVWNVGHAFLSNIWGMNLNGSHDN